MIRAAMFLALLSAAQLAIPQEVPPALAGTWEARLDGITYCVLKVTHDGDWAVRMTAVSLDTDDDGNITAVRAAGKESPMEDVKLEGDHLTFKEGPTAAQQDTPLEYELKLVTKVRAELRVISEPKPKLKAIPLHRRI